MISLRTLLSALALTSGIWLFTGSAAAQKNAAAQETEAPASAEQPAAEPAAEPAEPAADTVAETAAETASEPAEDYTPSLLQLTNPAIADQLGLTDQQRSIIAQGLADRVKQLSEAGEDAEKRTAVEAANDARLLEVFSDEQRRRWEAFAAGEAPLEPRLRFNFSFQPWVDVLEWFADQADLSLVLDAPPPGTFNYRDTKEYTPTEAIDLLNGVLLTKGYTLVRRDRMLLVLNVAGGIPEELIPQITLDELDKRGQFELVTLTFPLEGRPAAEVQAEVQPILGTQGSGEQGKVAVLAKTNQIVVTATAGKMRAIRALIDSIPLPDPKQEAKPKEPEKPSLETHAISGIDGPAAIAVLSQLVSEARIVYDPAGKQLVAYATPSQQAAIKTTLERMEAGVGEEGEPSNTKPLLKLHEIGRLEPSQAISILQKVAPEAQMSVHPATGKLVVWATPGEQADVAQSLGQLVGTSDDGSRQLEVYPVNNVAPQSVLTVLTAMLPGADIQVDANTNSIIALATVDEHRAISETVRQLDSASSRRAATLKYHVYEYKNADPNVITNLIQNLAPDAKVIPGTGDRRLTVIARDEDHAGIAELVDEVERAAPSIPPRPTYRVYPVVNADPAKVIELLRQMVDKATATASDDGRSITVIASPKDHKKVEDVLAQVEEQTPPRETPQLHVYDVSTDERSKLTLILQALAADLPNLRIVPDTNSSSITIFGTEAQHQRIAQIVGQLRQDASPETRFTLVAYPVKVADAAGIMATLQPLLPDAKLSVDTKTNAVIAWARPQDHAQIAEAIRKVDTEVPPERRLQLMRHRVDKADLSVAQQILSSLYPDVRVAVDANTKTIYTWASGRDQQAIDETLARMQPDVLESERATLVAYPLRAADSSTIAQALSAAVPSARIVADTANKRIIVMATPAEHVEIEKSVAALTQQPAAGVTLVVYPIDDLSSYIVSGILESVVPQARIIAGPSPQHVTVWANDEDHATVVATIEQLKSATADDEMKLVTYPIDAVSSSTATVMASRAAPNATVTYDAHASRLMIWAKADDHVKIREMLEQLVPEESSSRHLVVYPVGPEAASYATTLLTSVIPQPRYVWDTTHHRMMVWATPSEHEQLAEVFNQVADDESSNMELIVYPVDPDVVTSLASLLSTAAPEARVVPDTRTGRLMVWATQATHTTVAETIAKVVETESGALELVIYPMRAEDAAYAPTLVTSVAPQARYAPDTVHGRMLVWATPDEHEKLKRAFAEASVDASGEMSLVVYPTDSSSTANLQSLASSIVPQARVIPDARTGSLMVWATRTDHAKLTDALAKVTSSTSDEMKFVVYSVDTTLAPSLMGMVNSIAPQAKVVPDYTTGSLLVWANQQDQDTIKETLDRAGTDPARAMKLTVYPIESAQSSSITALLSQIVPRARVNYDTHSGNLLVWASEQDHAAVGEAMAQVGQSTDAGRYLLVYPLTGVNLASVTSVLSNVVPQARFIPEQQSGNLLAWGTQAEHEHIADAIEKVGKSSSENSLKVYALQGRPASTLATLLTGVVPQVRQTVDTNSGTVMVWASAADHALIEDAIAEIEAEQTAGYQPEVRIYDVLTADSVAVLSSLQTMFANRPDVRLSRDARTERIVAWGGEADHQQIGDVIAKFEEASPQLSTMQLEVYDLGTADSRTVVEALTPMFKDIKGTELIPDSANHQLIALALPEQQATIDATIRQLQAAKKDFDVLQLERVDTFTADDAIKTLFNGDPTPPTVDADYANQRVMVRGSDEQLEEIRQLLFKMGETNLAPSRRDDRRTMRVISVNGDIERALQEIQRVWPQLRGNPVRVVKPSAVYPTLRSNRKADEKPSPPAADEQSETTPAEETPEANTSPNDQSSINATRPEPLASRSVSPGSFTSPLALGVRSLATSLAVVNMLMQNVDEAVAATTTGPDDEPNVAESTATAPAAQPTENEPQPSPGDETSPIIVSPGVDGVTIVSDDTEALDDFEKLLRSILQNEANRQPEFKMIQLKHADATILTDTLEKAFGKSSSGTRYRSRTYGNRSSLTPPTFVAYERLNAVLVRADPEDLDAIERLVEALDTSELPETLLAPQPMQIQLKYAKAFRIERLLRDVYREQLSGQGRRRRVPTGFASALRELRGSGLSSDMTMTAIQQLTAQNQGPELTIGVDEQTNSLVIMASKPLLDEVREMVEALDVAADEAYHTVKVVPLEKTNAEAVQKALNMFTRERQVRDR